MWGKGRNQGESVFQDSKNLHGKDKRGEGRGWVQCEVGGDKDKSQL